MKISNKLSFDNEESFGGEGFPDCKDYFHIETVDWSTHSFTIVDNELVRDRYYYQCPSHYGKQDRDMMFL